MTTLPYTPVHEMDLDGELGSVMGFHLHGHGHDLDVIERFLDQAVDEHMGPGIACGWEISETWVRAVPERRYGGSRFVYTGAPGRGARAVTLLEGSRGWERWCLHHPYEPASASFPVEYFIDGRSVLAERLAALAEQIDPRPDVQSDECGDRLFFCRPCSIAIEERRRQAITAARDEVTPCVS